MTPLANPEIPLVIRILWGVKLVALVISALAAGFSVAFYYAGWE